LNESLWIDASHIIFFEKNCAKGQAEVDPDKLDAEKLFDSGRTNGINKNCSWFRSGLRVFGEEFLAVKILQKRIIYKPIVEKLLKADELLAEVSLFDAKDSSDQKRIAKAEEQLKKADEEISKNRLDKAIIRFALSWLQSQLAIKLVN
jgi:hypothetical protein